MASTIKEWIQPQIHAQKQKQTPPQSPHLKQSMSGIIMSQQQGSRERVPSATGGSIRK